MDDQLTQENREVVIRTPDQRLRVFVSSTLKELAEERQVVHQAILNLRLAPVMFESDARPHPAQKLYRAYLSQSHIFIGIYWQSYGWVAPGMQISGLEDEYNLSANMPTLIYIKEPAEHRDPNLTSFLTQIRNDNASCYKFFSTPDMLGELVENDLMILLSEYFETACGKNHALDEVSQHTLTNVPFPRNPLIGREPELAAVCDLLLREDVGLVTLIGPAGVGKSRLGIQIALELRVRFQDGVFLVGLESIQDPELVIPTIAKTLGLTETTRELSLVDSLKRYLCNKQVLLLLDNFEQVLAAASLVAEILEASPHIKILVTSRTSLHLRAEKEFLVSPLVLPPLKQALELQQLSLYSAVQLFIQRAQGIKPSFQVTNDNAQAVAEICHRLDGLPLAIELAAARIRILSPHMLLARLERRLEVLRGGTQDLPERQHTLYRAIDWSYNLLSIDDKRLLRYLSVFVGGWTLEAAEAVCNGEGKKWIETIDGLERLINSNLLRPPEEIDGELRIKQFETIREFAYERLIQCSESETVHARHAQYYLALAEQAEIELRQSSQQEWLKRLEAELENLRAAMNWMLGQGKNEITLRIAMALWRFWWTHGYWREGVQWLKSGLVGNGSIPDSMRAKALRDAGIITRFLGDIPQAIVMLQESLVLWRQFDDQTGIALVLSNLGASLLHQGDPVSATAMLEEALRLSQQQGDWLGMYTSLGTLGLAASRQGNTSRAIELYHQALAMAEGASDDIQIAKFLNSLGDEHLIAGDYDRAEDFFNQSATISQSLGNRLVEAYISGNRGIIAMKKGNYALAFDLLAEAILALQELGNKEEAILCLGPFALIAYEQCYPAKAARLLGASEALRNGIGFTRSKPSQTDYDLTIAKVSRQLGEAAFETAWSEGSRMTYEQAIAYAVDKSGQE